VRPPQVGFLWTPGYWGFTGAVFVFHPGHWGSTVGFYGGVNYGHGYFGNGYSGGHWIGSSFAYNSTVNHVDPAVAHHAYAESIPNQGSRGLLSHSGGPRNGTSTHTVPQHQAVTRTVAKPVTRTTTERTGETAPTPMNVDKPAAVAKTPTPSAPPKRVTPTRAAPIKQ